MSVHSKPKIYNPYQVVRINEFARYLGCSRNTAAKEYRMIQQLLKRKSYVRLRLEDIALMDGLTVNEIGKLIWG